MTAPSRFDMGLELFIMERELVLHEEAISQRRRRRFLRAAGALVMAGVLASGTGLAAAGTAPLPAARSAIDFLFPGESSAPDASVPETEPSTAVHSSDDLDEPRTNESTTEPQGTGQAPPAQTDAATPPLGADAPGKSADAPGHANDGTGTAPGNSGDHGNPSPPGHSGDHGNPNAPGQLKKN